MSAERDGNRLANLLDQLTQGHVGYITPLPGVRLMRAEFPTPRRPIVYDPSIVIVGQGCKIGYLGDQAFTYDPGNYLVLSVPLPFECEVRARPDKPFLGVSLSVDPVSLSELIAEMDDDQAPPEDVPSGIYTTRMHDELLDAVVRLLESLGSPSESRILGPQIVREITFRVLCGEQQGALRSLVARHGRFGQIAKVLRRIHVDYHQDIDVTSLAREANMSVSAFHHNFKSVTSTSPLQYLKRIRLHKARMLMLQDGLGVSVAANQVGYESASQFSREFKRYFGNTPVETAAHLRATQAKAEML